MRILVLTSFTETWAEYNATDWEIQVSLSKESGVIMLFCIWVSEERYPVHQPCVMAQEVMPPTRIKRGALR
jgi:hypothetical protein